jgi:hypothetical protein
MGEKSSAKFSAQGLTVNGSGFQGGAASEPAKGKVADKAKPAKS